MPRLPYLEVVLLSVGLPDVTEPPPGSRLIESGIVFLAGPRVHAGSTYFGSEGSGSARRSLAATDMAVAIHLPKIIGVKTASGGEVRQIEVFREEQAQQKAHGKVPNQFC